MPKIDRNGGIFSQISQKTPNFRAIQDFTASK